jgi:crossover junction endodeoxyribonuclease RuvC
MRVMGVDPGLTRCGIAIVQDGKSRKVELIEVLVARTLPSLAIAQRLAQLEQVLIDSVEKYQPEVMAIEQIFSQHNLRSVMGTAQAAGVAMLVAARSNIKVVTHTPTQVKAAVTGSGRADKKQVTQMVTKICNLDTAPTPADAADAIALAICHLWQNPKMIKAVS